MYCDQTQLLRYNEDKKVFPVAREDFDISKIVVLAQLSHPITA